MDGTCPSIGRDQLRRAFADTVVTLRMRRGISQEKLAQEAGVNRGYMGTLEREQHTPTIESIYKLLPVLGIGFIEFAAEFERILHSRRHPKT